MVHDTLTILVAILSAWLLLLAALWFIGLIAHLFWTALLLGWDATL